MNKPVYLGLSVLEISKHQSMDFGLIILNNARLCYMNTESFIIHIKTEDFYKDIADNLKKRHDISNYEVD